MTFIASLKVNNGIVLVSDGLETIEKSVVTLGDFEKEIEKLTSDGINDLGKLKKNLDKDKKFRSLSVGFKLESEKIIPIGEYACLQIAGTVEENGVNICPRIKVFIKNNKPSSTSDYESFCENFVTFLDNQKSISKNILLIYSFFDVNSGNKEIYVLNCSKKWKKRKLSTKYIYCSNHADYLSKIDTTIIPLTAEACLEEINEKRSFTFKEGYNLLYRIMYDVILHEAINEGRITIGGKIVFAFIDKGGFRSVESIEYLPDE